MFTLNQLITDFFGFKNYLVSDLFVADCTFSILVHNNVKYYLST